MKSSIFAMTLLLANVSFANPISLNNRFVAIYAHQDANEKFSLNYQQRQVFVAEGKMLKQEATFRLVDKDILLLRLTQNYNSRFDKLAFVAIYKTGTVNISSIFEYPANVPIEVTQKDNVVIAHLGIARSRHNYMRYDGQKITLFQKGAKAAERLAAPIPDEDCNTLYNGLYVPSFSQYACSHIPQKIHLTIDNTVAYKAMTIRSKLLNTQTLVDMAQQTCETKNLVIYNEFKTKVCGYSTLTPDINKYKNYAKE